MFWGFHFQHSESYRYLDICEEASSKYISLTDIERKGPQVGELTLFAHGGIDV